jgi:cyclic beta-1,2-glucan synthetase
MALAQLGQGDRAAGLFWLLNPINKTRTETDTQRYRVEPYAVAADVYAAPPHVGRGGWTWYTGAAGWLYRAGLESILGIRIEGDNLWVSPCIPGAWPGFEVRYRHGETPYVIEVSNPLHLSRGVERMTIDGTDITNPEGRIPLTNDGIAHTIRIQMGPGQSGRV